MMVSTILLFPSLHLIYHFPKITWFTGASAGSCFQSWMVLFTREYINFQENSSSRTWEVTFVFTLRALNFWPNAAKFSVCNKHAWSDKHGFSGKSLHWKQTAKKVHCSSSKVSLRCFLISPAMQSNAGITKQSKGHWLALHRSIYPG